VAGDQPASVSAVRAERTRSYSGAWASDHLDPVDVLHHRVLQFPEHAGEQRRIDAAPIDQHQQLIGEAAVEAARGDRLPAAVDPGDLDAGDQACPAAGQTSAIAFDGADFEIWLDGRLTVKVSDFL
jgi:hypothetical protein